jgi:hypothetical protein
MVAIFMQKSVLRVASMVTRAVLPLVMLAVSALACMVPLVAA